jgi:hypothetical protein
MDFEVNVRERMLKPVNEVFDAVVDPKKMSNYFISAATGPVTVGRVETCQKAMTLPNAGASLLKNPHITQYKRRPLCGKL